MIFGRNRLYLFLILVCSAGYFWLYNISSKSSGVNDIGFCFIKHFTGVPCPSCGSSRSVISLIHGNILESLFYNPFGILIAGIMLFTPIWILIDLVAKRDSLLQFYCKFESFVKKPHNAIPLILLLLANWIWNITKGL